MSDYEYLTPYPTHTSDLPHAALEARSRLIQNVRGRSVRRVATPSHSAGDRLASVLVPTPGPLSIRHAHRTRESRRTSPKLSRAVPGDVARRQRLSSAAGNEISVRDRGCPVNEIVREFLLETHEN